MEEARPSPRILALSLVGLAFFLAWQALALRTYISAGARPPSPDAVRNLEIALDYREAGPVAGWPGLMRLESRTGRTPGPPLYQFLLKFAYGDPDPAAAALWVNWFYLALLGIALFAIAWHFRPDETALLTVIIFAGSPVLQEMLHSQRVDLALTAGTAASYWALLRSDEFRKWAGSLACGALFAAGMLHHWCFCLYFLPVLYVGLLALSRPGSWFKVLAAGLVALAGLLPWYGPRLPALWPGLLQVPVDFTLGRGTAVLAGLGQMADGLGLPFFAFALIGLCIPQYRRNWHRGWVVAAWFIAAGSIWLLISQRRLGWLLPGLPALAVAGLGAWPRPVVWALAFVQLFTAVNFTSGWIKPIPLPWPAGSVALFPSQPPVRQDWHISDILRETDARRDPQRPLTVLTLVADDPLFNGADFAWTARLLHLAPVSVREPDKRLCEFSEFLLLKDDKPAPGRAGGLAETIALIKDPRGWFQQAYAEVRRWPLPDGAPAVLYQQKRPTQPPVKGRRLEYQYYTFGDLEVPGLTLEFGDWDAVRGVYRKAKLSAADFQLHGLRISGLRLEAEGLLFQPISEGGVAGAWSDLRLLKLDVLRIQSVRIQADTLRAFLEHEVSGLKISRLTMDKTLKASGDWGNLSGSVEFAVHLDTAPSALRLELVDAQWGDSPLPAGLLAPFRNFTRPLTPVAQTPFAIEIPGLTLSRGWLTVP